MYLEVEFVEALCEAEIELPQSVSGKTSVHELEVCGLLISRECILS